MWGADRRDLSANSLFSRGKFDQALGFCCLWHRRAGVDRYGAGTKIYESVERKTALTLSPLNQEESQQAAKRRGRPFFEGFVWHCITGVLAVLAHYTCMYAALWTGTAPVVATSLGFILGAFTRFVLARGVVFETARSVTESGWRFLAALFAQMAMNAGALSILVSAGTHVWVAQVTTTLALTFINYLVYRYWVFR